MGAMLLVALIAFLIVVVALVVTVTQAQRRIPVQYAKRVMGNKMFNGATQYLPLKLNYSGVMPVISLRPSSPFRRSSSPRSPITTPRCSGSRPR